MFRIFLQWIDRCAIEGGARAVGEGAVPNTNSEAAQLLAQADFFSLPSAPPPAFELLDKETFLFPSRIRTGFKNNDAVRGRLWTPRTPGKRAVLLVHGWNAEAQYWKSFPRMAHRLNRLGLAAAAIELPFHSNRRCDEPNAPRNFISGDLKTMLLATRQALNDLHDTALWLQAQGYSEIFVWGFSLGAWLSGLLCCFSDAISGAVLVTPVARMDKAINELAFCKPVKTALALSPFPFEKVNLTSHQPRITSDNILIVQSIYDLFAGDKQVEELCQRWNNPERWRVKHGHVSILFSGRQMRLISDWISKHPLTSSGLPGSRKL